MGLTFECPPTIYSEGLNPQLHLISREFSGYRPDDASHSFPNFKTEEVRLIKDVPDAASFGFWLPWQRIPLPSRKMPSEVKQRVGVLMSVKPVEAKKSTSPPIDVAGVG